MATGSTKSTYTKAKETPFSAKTTGELLIVTHNTNTSYTDITTPLTRNNVNLECFTTYRWGGETAFRLVTSDNRKAREILKCAGYTVQESPVTLWYTKNEPGRFNKAMDALTKARIETYCTYSTSVPNSRTMIIAFDTNDTMKTSEVLSRIR